MNQNNALILLCTSLFMWVSCTHEALEKNELQLQLAERTVDQNPKEALHLLEGLDNPEKLNPDDYMQYVVLHTQARYMNLQDITGDTLIFEAQRYFKTQNQPDMAARASYYAACFCYKLNEWDRSLEYYLQAHYYSQQAGNRLFEAKSAHCIGNAYFVQELFDSTRVYLLQAQELYNQSGTTENNRLELLYILGRACREQQKLDEARTYYSEGLELAKKYQNEPYEARFLRNTGILHHDQKEYKLAKTYFDQALSKKQDQEDEIRVYICLAQLYRDLSMPDSAKYYLDSINERMTEITYPDNRKTVFQMFANYYDKVGNTKEVRHYLNLANAESLKNEKIINQKKTLQTVREFETFKEQEAQKRSNIILIAIFIAVFLLLVTGWIGYLLRKKKKKLRSTEVRQLLFDHFHAKKAVNCYKWLHHEQQACIRIFQDHYPNVPIETIREIFDKQHAIINELFAEWSRQYIQDFPQGNMAVEKLSNEDLCFMHLYHQGYSDEAIAEIMAYPYYSSIYMESRWEEMRDVMQEAGMRDEDIRQIIPASAA